MRGVFYLLFFRYYVNICWSKQMLEFGVAKVRTIVQKLSTAKESISVGIAVLDSSPFGALMAILILLASIMCLGIVLAIFEAIAGIFN
jgi:hypothetical protein